MISYDPRYGTTIRVTKPNDVIQHATWKCSLKGKANENNILNAIKVSEYKPISEILEIKQLSGIVLSIECIVTVEIGMKVEIIWELPNGITDERVKFHNVTETSLFEDYKVKVVSRIEIHNVDWSKDIGSYRCTVRDANLSRNLTLQHHSYAGNIFRLNHTFIDLNDVDTLYTSNSINGNLTISEKLLFYMDRVINYDYRFPRIKHDDFSIHSSFYGSPINDFDAFVRSPDYVIFDDVSDNRNHEIEVKIIVLRVPVVNIYWQINDDNIGTSVKVSCEYEGYPPPTEVNFNFTTCSLRGDTPTCGSPSINLMNPDFLVSSWMPGIEIDANLTLIESGYLTCEVMNDMGVTIGHTQIKIDQNEVNNCKHIYSYMIAIRSIISLFFRIK